MVDFIISLDGYAAAEGWPGYWGLEGPEYLAWIQEQAAHEHEVLMGADDLPADVRVRRGRCPTNPASPS